MADSSRRNQAKTKLIRVHFHSLTHSITSQGLTQHTHAYELTNKLNTHTFTHARTPKDMHIDTGTQILSAPPNQNTLSLQTHTHRF